jgi:L,D-transpeptidase ErfK/SrfK
MATTYTVPLNGNDMIGGVETTSSASGDTLGSIAQREDIGINGITNANPGIDPEAPLPSGTAVNIPSEFLLPPLPHRGIVINLAEMRMYYYPTDDVVKTYPIGIGRVGKTIPIKETKVVRKVEHPVWIPPEDIRAFNKEQGIILPRVMPAGPDNPLGPYAIYLQIPTYLIHSTIFPSSIGTRASFGCIRMFESDIHDFFPLVESGTPVIIVDMPTKVGWVGNRLYLETHEPLEEHSDEAHATNAGIVNAIAEAVGSHRAFVDWQLVEDIANNRDGLPHEIGFRTD